MIVQLRNDTEGRAYYRRKLAAGKTPMEAMRALKRRLSDIVYRQLVADQKHQRRTAAGTGPGGQVGAASGSSPADSNPNVDASEKSLPGPGETRGYSRHHDPPRPIPGPFPAPCSSADPQGPAHPRQAGTTNPLTQRGAMSGSSRPRVMPPGRMIMGGCGSGSAGCVPGRAPRGPRGVPGTLD